MVKRASTLQLHEKLCASKIEEIKVTGCVHCDFASASPSEMLEHIYSNHRHILARKFCERCGKNFKATDSLKRHMKMHLDIREKCPLENCGMMIRDLQRYDNISKRGIYFKEVHFASVLSGGFITVISHPPDRKLAKRTSVYWSDTPSMHILL